MTVQGKVERDYNREARKAVQRADQEDGPAQPTFCVSGSYRKSQDARAAKIDGGWAIEGLVPATQTAVWFGESGIGKTMIELWKALCIAARGPNAPSHWCGQPILKRGIVIIYSGEDTLEEGRERLRDMAEGLMGLRGDELQDTIERVVFINPAYLDDDEFTGFDPVLFEKGRNGKWRPSGNAEGILASIEQINSEATQADEKVVGIIIDSATSVAGFDAMEGEAVSRFFFWATRICNRYGIFALVLGHIAQKAKIDPYAPEHRARYRLRGVVVWVTAPRLVVEVRVPLGLNATKKAWSESMEAIGRGIITKPEQALTVAVVKANGKDACRRKLWLRWSRDHVFTDVTNALNGVARSKEQFDDFQKQAKIEKAAASGQTQAEHIDRNDASEAVLAMCQHLAAGGKPFTITALHQLRKKADWIKEHPVLSSDDDKGGMKPKDGGIDNNDARPGSVKWHVDKLIATGELIKVKGGFALAGAEAEVEQDQADVAEIDRAAAIGAVLAIARHMVEHEREVRLDEKAIQDRALSTKWREEHQALALSVDQGGLSRNRIVRGAPARLSYHWALDELVAMGMLVRAIEGHYVLPSGAKGHVLEPTESTEPVIETDMVVDRAVAADAILAIVERKAAGDAKDATDGAPPSPGYTAAEIERNALSTLWRKTLPILGKAVEDGGIARNRRTKTGEPVNWSTEWFLDELARQERLERTTDGTYRPLQSVPSNNRVERVSA